MYSRSPVLLHPSKGEIVKHFVNKDYHVCGAFQAVQLGSRERLLAFCEAVQKSSPVSSFTRPIAGTTPGYASEVTWL